MKRAVAKATAADLSRARQLGLRIYATLLKRRNSKEMCPGILRQPKACIHIACLVASPDEKQQCLEDPRLTSVIRAEGN